MDTFAYRNKLKAITIILSTAYICFLYPYYNIPYFVPDYGLYHYFGLQNLPSKDAFSSLFIDIIRLFGYNPHLLHISMLTMITLSILLLNLAIIRIFKSLDWYISLLAILSTYVWGFWYYFCGKLYYEFPFAVFTCSIALYIFSWISESDVFAKNVKPRTLWYLLFTLLGFSLSFKTYNIFYVVGLILIIVTYKQISFKEILSNYKLCLQYIVVFVIGYICGMYHLVTDFKETLVGISAYSDHFDIKEFFIGKGDTRIIWDHVFDTNFDTGVVKLVTLRALVLLSLLFARRAYFVIWLGITVFFCVYIENFSPGYQWHGFPYGLFNLIFCIFVIRDVFDHVKSFHIKSIILAILIMAFSIQAVNNFGYYIPKEKALQNSIYTGIEVAIYEQSLVFDQLDKYCYENQIIPENLTVEIGIHRTGSFPFTDPRWKQYKETSNAPQIYIQIKPQGYEQSRFLYDFWNKTAMNKIADKVIIYENSSLRIWALE